MILSERVSVFPVPHTSKCIIHTKGVLKDGDTVEISSPVFPSFDLTTNALNTSSKFNVGIKILSDTNIESDGNLEATLVCDDNDTTSMYVRV